MFSAHRLRTSLVRGISLGFLLLLPTVHAQESLSPDDYRVLIAQAVRDAANVVLPSIVTIEQIGTAATGGGEVSEDAPTSGLVVSEQGHILTSSLVVKNPSASLLVTLPDSTRKAAKIVAQDHHRELVLLKIETDGELTPIQFATNPSMRIGETVVGVGRYGTGLSPMVSRGVLSAVGRLDGIAIQTDARVSPSLYGGPLIDLSGQVLGILIPAVAEGGAENITDWYDSGIAFAIPAETLAIKLERLMAGESIKPGVIGIVARSKDPYDDGTEVATVRVRSPAELAGIRAGDVIESVAGNEVKRHLDIKQSLGAFDAGDTIQVKLRRGDETLEVDVKLVDSIPPLEPQRLGVIARRRSVDGDESSEVVVDSVLPSSPVTDKIEPDDVILRIGDAEIRDVQTLRRVLLTSQGNTALTITVRRGEKELTVEATPETVSAKLAETLPASLVSKSKSWNVETLKLPDAPNEAAIVAPSADTELSRLGLLVLLTSPGGEAPEKELANWAAAATKAGVVVCAVAPQDSERWKPEEIEVISRLAALTIKQHAIDPAAVAVATEGSLAGKDAGASDAMAIAVAITEKRTFAGVAVSSKTRPPAVRLTENDPESPLQFLMSGDELPSWAAPLKKAGYPLIADDQIDQERLLSWVRLLQAI